MRRAVAAVAVAALALPLAASGATATQFSDVRSSHPFAKEITWLVEEGITTGYSNGTFRPSSKVTRDAFAAFLYRLADEPPVTLPDKSPFVDITPSNTAFYEEIVWLEQQDITTGWETSRGVEFRPFASITRDAMAAFLYRLRAKDSTPPPSTSATSFDDIDEGSGFLTEISWLVDQEITTGYPDNTFRPFSSVTRDATAAFLYRYSGAPPVVPTSFTVSGAGFGHGVGMSQYGAQGMAVSGTGAGDILKHYYQGASVATVDADREIRVETFGSGADSRDRVDIVVRSPGSSSSTGGEWRLRFYDRSDEVHTTWTGKKDEKLEVTRDGNDMIVERADGTRKRATYQLQFHWEATEFYQPTSTEDPYVQLLKADGSRASHGDYRHGRMIIRVPSTTYPRLIASNWLDLNTEYLYGIAEMPSSWDMDALRSQAIVARSYALRQAQTYSETCVCHLYDDTRSQNFTGWRKESEGTNAYYGKRWVAAVDETSSAGGTDGKVMMAGGAIAQTYYFSSSGGRTENSEDIWSSNLSYLRAVDDRWSLESRNPNRAWTRTLTQAQAATLFGLPDVASIAVTSRTSGSDKAAATRVTATSSTGDSKSITGAENIRSRVVGGQSPWIWSFRNNY